MKDAVVVSLPFAIEGCDLGLELLLLLFTFFDIFIVFLLISLVKFDGLGDLANAFPSSKTLELISKEMSSYPPIMWGEIVSLNVSRNFDIVRLGGGIGGSPN